MIEDKTEADAMREHQWRIALADAIRRPMGVIPDSAIGLVDATDLARAEWRRMNTEGQTTAKPLSAPLCSGFLK